MFHTTTAAWHLLFALFSFFLGVSITVSSTFIQDTGLVLLMHLLSFVPYLATLYHVEHAFYAFRDMHN
jgi:hypothetical protein